jgi:hypothetical protein
MLNVIKIFDNGVKFYDFSSTMHPFIICFNQISKYIATGGDYLETKRDFQGTLNTYPIIVVKVDG